MPANVFEHLVFFLDQTFLKGKKHIGRVSVLCMCIYYVCMPYQTGLLDTVQVTHQWLFNPKETKNGSCSVHKVGCLGYPSLMLKAQRTDGCLSMPKAWRSSSFQTTVKECVSNRVDELASKSKDKQGKSKVAVFHALLSLLPLEDATHI